MTNPTEIQLRERDYRVYRNHDGRISRVTVFVPEWEAAPWEAIPLSSAVVAELDKLTN